MQQTDEVICGLESEHVHSISKHMAKLLKRYSEIRGKPVNDGDFWDAVVITTADEEQSRAYKYQLQRKVLNKEVPENVPFYLYADPHTVKIGSGGSILYALDQLHATLGDDVFRLRILLICAGGKSQRLPTASILGKLFLPLPLGEPTFHMLDLKLALYLPFLRHMKPGVLITCSDDVETYCLPYGDAEQQLWSFSEDGFTALGTISSTDIGRNHGVYVLPTCSSEPIDTCVIRSSCLQVLQKPSLQLMMEKGAILKDGNVCTDSIYFFDHLVSRKFLDFMKSPERLTSEIDAYGDFLQPLGVLASRDYIGNTANVLSATSTLAANREELFSLLHQTPLHVVALQLSRFYHLGTMAEYVENITPNDGNSFFEELNCLPVAFSHVSDAGHDSGWALQEFVRCNPNVTVMHSCIESNASIGRFVVLEYSHVSSPIEIGDYCILSNCRICCADVSSKIVVPPRSCFHTAAVQIGTDVKFVTIAFGLQDDLKKSVPLACSGATELEYLGVPLQRACNVLDIAVDDLFAKDAKSFSLWTARLFLVADSMEESFAITSFMTCKLLNYSSFCDSPLPLSSVHLSMAEIVQYKCVKRMIKFQENLRDIITGRERLS